MTYLPEIGTNWLSKTEQVCGCPWTQDRKRHWEETVHMASLTKIMSGMLRTIGQVRLAYWEPWNTFTDVSSIAFALSHEQVFWMEKTHLLFYKTPVLACFIGEGRKGCFIMATPSWVPTSLTWPLRYNILNLWSGCLPAHKLTSLPITRMSV